MRALFACALLVVVAATARTAVERFAPGTVHQLVFPDVDGNQLSTSDGRVTILTVVTRADEEKARAVADLVPDRYVGNPKYQYITLVNFEGKVPGPWHGLTRAIIRGRLAFEAQELQPQYEARKLGRDPRRDLHVIADFDGSAAGKLGLAANAGEMAVFVFNGQGRIVARWPGVPPGNSLAKALEAAR